MVCECANPNSCFSCSKCEGPPEIFPGDPNCYTCQRNKTYCLEHFSMDEIIYCLNENFSMDEIINIINNPKKVNWYFSNDPKNKLKTWRESN